MIDNARLYTERSRIAHTLQAELLPSRLPEIPGATVAVRYRAAGELNEVGGDFYDVFHNPDGSWARRSATSPARAPRPPRSPRSHATPCAQRRSSRQSRATS